MMEEWRAIPTLEDYEASNIGRIRRATPGVGTVPGFVLKPKLIAGYWCLRLIDNGKARTKRVNRLVMAAFSGVMPSRELDCNHINGVKGDNRIENLEWCTRSENQKHAVRLGLLKPPKIGGEDHHGAKITSEQLTSIKMRVMAGEKQSKLAAEFGITTSSLSKAVSGKTWKSHCL